MAGVRKKSNPGGKYHGWFTNAQGKQQFFTGTRSRTETRRIAQQKEEEHRQVRLGYREAPKAADTHRLRSFEEVKDEYLAWGETQGGRRGRPWGQTHARMRRSYLKRWQAQLNLLSLADLPDIFPRVERALRAFSQNRAGKTVMNYVEALSAFCDWCVQRGYLEADPLRNLVAFDTEPQTIRRAMPAEDIARLFEVSAPHNRLLYETAFISGLRATELRNLDRTKHLDKDRGGLHLEAAWTKNRKPGFQPLPARLVAELDAFSQSGAPARLYAKAYRGRPAVTPDEPLLYVPSHPARTIDRDMEAAGIPKYTPKGKVDFHAARTAYINLLLEDDQLTPKDTQELARHSTTRLTLDVYGRANDERMARAIERLDERIRPIEPAANNAIIMQKVAVGSELKSATPLITRELRSLQMVEAAGIEPQGSYFRTKHF